MAGSPRGLGNSSYPTASTSAPPPFLAGSPKLPPAAGTATTPTAAGTTTPSTSSSSAIPDSSAPASSAWSAIPPRLTPDRVAPTVQLIELGEGWSVRYRAWKAPAILVAACQQGGGVASARASRTTTTGRMDYDPWKAPLGSPSSFTTAGAAKPNRATKDESNAPARATICMNEAGPPPPPSKKARTTMTTTSSSDSANTGIAAKGNAFDDLLAQEMTSSSVGSNTTLTGAVTASEATTPSILMDAIKTPPLAANSVNAAERKPSLRVPAALRKAKAREEAAATVAAAAGATAPDKDLVVHSGPATAPTSSSLQSSTASSTLPAASTSSSSSSSGIGPKSSSDELRNRLAPICSDPTFCSRDPLELALSTLRSRRAEYAKEGRDRLDLLWHVERHAVTLVGDESDPPSGAASTTDRKGKRKEVPGDASASADDSATSAAGEEGAASPWLRRGDGHARVLWAFSVVKGGEKDPDDDLDMGSLDQVLVDLEFEGLEGEFLCTPAKEAQKRS